MAAVMLGWCSSVQLYASLVGMFELNNLALSIPAPVAQYQEMLETPAASGLDADSADAALAEVAPLLEALGDSADLPAEVSSSDEIFPQIGLGFPVFSVLSSLTRRSLLL
jgi:hypothetical protein